MEGVEKYLVYALAVILISLLSVYAIEKWSLNTQVHNAQMQPIEMQKLKQCKTN